MGCVLAEMVHLVFSAYGCSIAVELPMPFVPSLLVAMPPGYVTDDQAAVPDRCWRMSPAPDGAMQAFADDGVLITDYDASVVLEILISDLELWVAEHAPQLVFVHAGCVALHGRAILLPGATMAGKSTLVAALTRAGATYYSDEYAVLDSSGFVWPYARALCLRAPTGGPSRRVHPDDLGVAVGDVPVPVGLVATLRYDDQAGWDVTSAAQGEAVLSLIENSVAARRSPEAVLTALVAATNRATAIVGTRADSEAAALHLLNHLAAQQPAVASPPGFPFADAAP